jgi:uncharacterized Zn finger protein|tara:strand:+ start:563 stop:826 length:264 start_codon:yes stop_codon:yes gene_type:complete
MSIVSQKTVLTQEELDTLKDLQDKTQALIQELGEIELSRLQLTIRHEAAKDFLEELQTTELEYTKTLSEKYGKSQINPETGEVSKVE